MESYTDRISLLHDDLLLRILSLLPTKDVLKTTVLAKRWSYLWKLVHKLTFYYTNENSNHEGFVELVDRTLLLHTAPVLESLHFKLDRRFRDVDIGFWIRIAVKRGLRELNFDYNILCTSSRLPQSLFTCGTLVVLKLKNVSLEYVQFPVCFQLLKTLHLSKVFFLDDESPRKLLSSCPVLEILVLDRAIKDNVTTFSVKVPSLQCFIYDGTGLKDSKLFLNAPSLKYFKIVDIGNKCMIEYMPEIVEANVKVSCTKSTEDILRSLASLKCLLLCLPLKSPFPMVITFHQLVHLEFCTCAAEWDLLMSMLQHSPKLRSLKLYEIHDIFRRFPPFRYWDEPSSVPETLMFGLETFEWRNYRGWRREMMLAKYFLKHSRCLKIATFVTRSTKLRDKYRLISDLTFLSRGSTECQLVFS